MTIHETAIIDPRAGIGDGVEIGPHCIVDEHVRVGSGCRIMHGAYLTGWTDIGEECIVHPGSIVGHAPQDTKYKGERSYTRIGPRTTLREYTTVHRGSGRDSETVIGADCLLCAGAHVGHNSFLGDRVVLGDNVLLAGHTRIGTCVRMGAGAGVHQFTRIGEWAKVESDVTIRADIVPYAFVSHDDHIAGINEVALERSTEEEAADLRALLHLFLSGHRSFTDLRRRIAGTARTATGHRFAEFVCAESRRGFAGGEAAASHRTAE